MSGRFSNCCCTLPCDDVFVMGMVKHPHNGFYAFIGTNEEQFYDPPQSITALGSGIFLNGYSWPQTVGVPEGAANSMRYMRFELWKEQSTSYGGLRQDTYKVEYDSKTMLKLFEESTDSFGGLNRTEKFFGSPTNTTTVSSGATVGDDPAKDAAYLQPDILIHSRQLTVDVNSYQLVIRGEMPDPLGSFIYTEIGTLSSAYSEASALADANTLLALYSLPDDFNGSALADLRSYGNAMQWLCDGWSAVGDDTTGYTLTPNTPTMSTAGLADVYNLATDGAGAVIPFVDMLPFGCAFNAIGVHPTNGTVFAFAAKNYFYETDGWCANNLILDSYSGATFKDLTYSHVDEPECEFLSICGTGLLECDKINQLKVLYLFDQFAAIEAAGHTIPTCCESPPP